MQRHLAAILCADVVSYSRLMGDDEEATVETLSAYREVFTERIDAQHGRVLDAKGDALLAEFHSVVEAVSAAAAIQREIARRNVELPETRRMRFRIGINLGDVLERDDTIYGDGVNIAARLESLADPGGLCISSSAYEQVKNKLDLEYEYQGRKTVKNIADPVGVYQIVLDPAARQRRLLGGVLKGRWGRRPAMLLLAAGLATALTAGVWMFYPRIAAPPAEPIGGGAFAGLSTRSIAVLPFVAIGGDAAQDLFSAGLTETLITDFAKLEEFFRVSRAPQPPDPKSPPDPREVGRSLGAQYVMEGTVQIVGQRARIIVQLTDVETGRKVWAERYDREADNRLALQDEITRKIVSAMMTELFE
ncbi:MAG: hypothetical protein O7A67_00185 [SAR324 cluster bacterium]|nr:hypothetical protein [SAR324 cluster bacterium]